MTLRPQLIAHALALSVKRTLADSGPNVRAHLVAAVSSCQLDEPCWQSRTPPLHYLPKRRCKRSASWVRTGLLGPASREQTPNADFANKVRTFDEVVQFNVHRRLLESGTTAVRLDARYRTFISS